MHCNLLYSLGLINATAISVKTNLMVLYPDADTSENTICGGDSFLVAATLFSVLLLLFPAIINSWSEPCMKKIIFLGCLLTLASGQALAQFPENFSYGKYLTAVEDQLRQGPCES